MFAILRRITHKMGPREGDAVQPLATPRLFLGFRGDPRDAGDRQQAQELGERLNLDDEAGNVLFVADPSTRPSGDELIGTPAIRHGTNDAAAAVCRVRCSEPPDLEHAAEGRRRRAACAPSRRIAAPRLRHAKDQHGGPR